MVTALRSISGYGLIVLLTLSTSQTSDVPSDQQFPGAESFTLCDELQHSILNSLVGRLQLVADLAHHLQLERDHTHHQLELELRLGGRPQHTDETDASRALHLHREQAKSHASASAAILAQLKQALDDRAAGAEGADGTATEARSLAARAASDLRFLPLCLLASAKPSHNPSHNPWAEPPSLGSAAQASDLKTQQQTLKSSPRRSRRVPTSTGGRSRRPLVSLLVQYFNRPWMLPVLAKAFRGCSAAYRNAYGTTGNSTTAGSGSDGGLKRGGSGDEAARGGGSGQREGGGVGAGQPLYDVEMLINVDSRTDAAAVAEFAAGPLASGFVVLVYSNNVHEIRSYNRLARLARGKILVMLQDDDVFPEDAACSWLSSLVRAFKRWPRMGAIGSQRFVFDYHPNTTNYGVHFYDPGNAVRYGTSKGAAGGPRRSGIPSSAAAAAGGGARLDMQFVTIIDYAPVAVRRSAFFDVGGIDENMSESGMCGVHSDYDLAMRMWLAGWQVGYVELPGLSKDPREEEGGTHRKGVSGYCWQRQWEQAIEYMRGRWGHHCRWDPESYYWFGSNVFEVLAEHVRLINLKLLQPVSEPTSGFCPFGYGCGEVPVDNITGVPSPVSPLFGNLTTWPKHTWARWSLRQL